MPSWPGGPCPECNEDMPANLIRCVNCRVLLNNDLELESVEIPAYKPLPEITSFLAAKLRGYYVACPHCKCELRINSRFVGKKLSCKKCKHQFDLNLADEEIKKLGFYLDCPSCEERLRVSQKYAGKKAVCKFCSSKLQFVE